MSILPALTVIGELFYKICIHVLILYTSLPLQSCLRRWTHCSACRDIRPRNAKTSLPPTTSRCGPAGDAAQWAQFRSPDCSSPRVLEIKFKKRHISELFLCNCIAREIVYKYDTGVHVELRHDDIIHQTNMRWLFMSVSFRDKFELERMMRAYM